MKENDHLVLRESRTFYLEISPHLNRSLKTNQGHPCWRGSGWNVGVSRVCSGWRFRGDGQTLCGWPMEGLRSSAERGFGPTLGKPCEAAVELLPDGLSLRLSVHVLPWESLARPPVVGFLVGLTFIVRPVWLAQSPLYGRHEAQMEEKGHLIGKKSAAREECAGLQSSLDDGGRESH